MLDVWGLGAYSWVPPPPIVPQGHKGEVGNPGNMAGSKMVCPKYLEAHGT